MREESARSKTGTRANTVPFPSTKEVRLYPLNRFHVTITVQCLYLMVH